MKRTKLFASSEWTVNEFTAWKREQTKAYAFASFKKKFSVREKSNYLINQTRTTQNIDFLHFC